MNDIPLRQADGTVATDAPNLALAAEWDRFVTTARSVHVEQLTVWGEVRRLDGWHPTLLVSRHAGALVGGALVLTRRITRWLEVGYVARGPLIAAGSAAEEAATAGRLLAALQRFARTRRLAGLIVDPPYFCGALPAALSGAGFTPHLPRLPPIGLMRGTLLVDLRATEDELLARMRRSTRKAIRKAGKSALRVRRGNEDDIASLWRLMQELCHRRGCISNVSSPEIMRGLWTRLTPAGAARIDVLENDGEPIAAMLTLCLGSWAIPWRIGWSGAEARLSPEKTLCWSVMRSVRSEGMTVFDFNWVDPNDADALRNGEGVPDSTNNTGVTTFKTGFGGEIVRLASPMDYFPNPFVRATIRFGGARLANSPRLTRLLAWVNRRAR